MKGDGSFLNNLIGFFKKAKNFFKKKGNFLKEFPFWQVAWPGNFLKAAAVSPEKAAELTQFTRCQIQVTMFAAGVGTLDDLKTGKVLDG